MIKDLPKPFRKVFKEVAEKYDTTEAEMWKIWSGVNKGTYDYLCSDEPPVKIVWRGIGSFVLQFKWKDIIDRSNQLSNKEKDEFIRV